MIPIGGCHLRDRHQAVPALIADARISSSFSWSKTSASHLVACGASRARGVRAPLSFSSCTMATPHLHGHRRGGRRSVTGEADETLTTTRSGLVQTYNLFLLRLIPFFPVRVPFASPYSSCVNPEINSFNRSTTSSLELSLYLLPTFHNQYLHVLPHLHYTLHSRKGDHLLLVRAASGRKPQVDWTKTAPVPSPPR